MQRSLLGRGSILMLAFAAVVAAACSDDSNGAAPLTPTAAKQGTTGSSGSTDTSGSTPTPTPTPTSTGPVASIHVTPQAAQLAVGYYLSIGVSGFDANGALVLGAKASFRSSNASIVAVASDTGIVRGVAVGTAKVYATIQGHTDSATIVVVPGLAQSPGPAQSPDSTPVLGVAKFDFAANVRAIIAGADTTLHKPVAGALVKLTRTSGVTGDALATAIDAGSATSDADGNVKFVGLAGGAYAIEVTPPDGLGLAPLKTGFAPPTTGALFFNLTLQPKH